MQVIEQYSRSKNTTTPSEDSVVVSAYYAAVIDGATPKNSYRYGEESPGQLAARVIAKTIENLEKFLTAEELIGKLNKAIAEHIPAGITKDSFPTASIVLYNNILREVIVVGDCIFATKSKDDTFKVYKNEKLIDLVLSDWRSSIVKSLIERGIYSKEEIGKEDKGRGIIQPFITAQVRFQNTIGYKYSFGAIDGTDTPSEHIRVFKIDRDIEEIILASDGYKELLPTLEQSEASFQLQIDEDPLCIGILKGTKGIKRGNVSFDDRTYLRLKI